eukprot:TRINITY_DN11557_c0_g1_i2.p1 TRINITY_DN11557_c0_g1~~TRINITY_DN11557_c0_g1_i2.p1  ORF type:complete len:307 (-),score=21.31 TRINITY_DN11557_c0_g1_i2:39-959(-)
MIPQNDDKTVEEAIELIKSKLLGLSTQFVNYSRTHVLALGWKLNKEDFLDKDLAYLTYICAFRGYNMESMMLDDIQGPGEAIAKKIYEMSSKDNLVIVYISCHGSISPDLLSESLILSPGAKKELDFDSIMLNLTYCLSRKAGEPRNILFLIDSCYSGGAIKSDLHNIQILAACSKTDTTSYDRTDGSFFTKCLYEVLAAEKKSIEVSILHQMLLEKYKGKSFQPIYKPISGTNVIIFETGFVESPGLYMPESIKATIGIKVNRKSMDYSTLKAKIDEVKRVIKTTIRNGHQKQYKAGREFDERKK